jgi:hypothetical protein
LTSPFTVFYVDEVETVFKNYGDESKARNNYMKEYSELQVLQLKELIRYVNPVPVIHILTLTLIFTLTTTLNIILTLITTLTLVLD